MTVSAIIAAACFIMAFIANIAALAYGYGTLSNRVKNCEERDLDQTKHTEELFRRMSALEQLAGRIEDAALRWEKIMNNGINTKIADIQERIARLEQICEDQKRKENT